MNVVKPRLLPQVYPRANYLKREIEHARRFIVTSKKSGELGLSEYLADYLEAAAAGFRVAVSNPTDEANGAQETGA